jgi:hypothetical protein
MMHYRPIIIFDIQKQELSLKIGNETLIMEGYIPDNEKLKYQAVLNSYGEEQLIKRLVANMELK